MLVTDIHIFTCVDERPANPSVHIKILADAGGQPGSFLYEEDLAPASFVADGPGRFKVTVFPSTPFNATANTTFWVGVSGNNFVLAQFFVFGPADASVARFLGRIFQFNFFPGDMMFQLTGRPAVTPVAIDIKPGSDPNSINTKSKGTIPVAILSTPDFDATQEVDKTSLTFGKTGDEESLAKCTKSNEDVNGDGLDDVVCHFNTQDTGFQQGDTEGILRGQTADGRDLEGRDAVRIVN